MHGKIISAGVQSIESRKHFAFVFNLHGLPQNRAARDVLNRTLHQAALPASSVCTRRTSPASPLPICSCSCQWNFLPKLRLPCRHYKLRWKAEKQVYEVLRRGWGSLRMRLG